MEPIPDGYYVDHINHNTVDCRKENLRLCTPSQNAMNSKISANNKSGCKGVRFIKHNNKWIATIVVDHKTIKLGYFDTYEEAVVARLFGEEQYHKEFYNKDLRKLYE